MSIFLIDFGSWTQISKFYLSQINPFGYMTHSFPSFPLYTCLHFFNMGHHSFRDVNGLKKKKKGNPRQHNEIWKLCNPPFIVCPHSKTLLIAGCIVFLAFYKSGWRWLLGAGFEGDGRDLFLTTLAKGSRAVSESECTWLSIIISRMLWLLMHCLVFRYSRKFGLR